MATEAEQLRKQLADALVVVAGMKIKMRDRDAKIKRSRKASK
jgi:hypothetical protein